MGLFHIAVPQQVWYHIGQKFAPTPHRHRGQGDVGTRWKIRWHSAPGSCSGRDGGLRCCCFWPRCWGALAGLLDAVFGQGILAVTAFREAYPLLMLLLPVAGLLIVFVYARWGGDCGRGMALVFDTAAGKRERPPRRLIPLAIGATWVTHLFGGSVGREGVAVQISAAAAGLLTPALRTARSKRLLMITAVAAGFSGLFRTSACGGVFCAGTVPCGHGGIRRAAARSGGLAGGYHGERCTGAETCRRGAGGRSRCPLRSDRWHSWRCWALPAGWPDGCLWRCCTG